jgi:hypothetical protein
MYILAPNQNVEKYPYSIGDLRKDNPQVSFPRNPSEELLASYDVYPVQLTSRPEGDVVSEGLPIFNEQLQRWERYWIVRNFTQEEIEQQLLEKRQNMVVSMRQARLALLQVGLLSQVEGAISSLQEPIRSALQIEWEYSTTFERMNPWVLQLAIDVLNLSDSEVDSLFELAKEL